MKDQVKNIASNPVAAEAQIQKHGAEHSAHAPHQQASKAVKPAGKSPNKKKTTADDELNVNGDEHAIDNVDSNQVALNEAESTAVTTNAKGEVLADPAAATNSKGSAVGGGAATDAGGMFDFSSALPLIALLGGGAAIAAAAGGGGSGGGGGGGTVVPAVATTTLHGTVTLGQVVSTNDLYVWAYKADGTMLASAKVFVTGNIGDYTLSYTATSYTGAVLLKVVDTGPGVDGINDSTGVAGGLTSKIYAVASPTSGVSTVANLNEATTIAAIMLGIVQSAPTVTTGSSITAADTSAAAIMAVNKAVALLAGYPAGTQIIDHKPTTTFTVDASDNIVAQTPDDGGVFLKKLTDMGINGGISLDQVMINVAAAITINSATSTVTLTPALQALLAAGTVSDNGTVLTNGVSAAEAAAGLTFKIVLPDTAQAGDSVAMHFAGTATVVGTPVVLTATDITNGFVTLPVAGASLGADGSKSLVSVIKDANGIAGVSSNALTFTLDTIAAAPTLALTTDSGSSTIDLMSNLGTVIVTGETNAVIEYSLNGTSGWSTIAPTPTLGVNTVYARQTDVAGNVSAASAAFTYYFDPVAPAAPTLALTTDSGSSGIDKISNNGALTIGGQEVGAIVEYSLNGTSGWSATPPTPVQGSNTVYVRQIDVAGNVSAASAPFIYTFDTTIAAPTVALTADNGSSTTDRISDVGTLDVSGTEVGATVEYSTDNITWSATAPTPTQGSNTVYVRQTDVAGNVSPASSITFTLDTAIASPTVALTTDSGSSVTDLISNNGALTVSGTETGALVEYSLNGTSGWSATAPTPVQGSNTVYVRQTDLAGNVSPASSALIYTLDTAAPVVNSVAISSATVVVNSTLRLGNVVSVAVNMSEATIVDTTGGTPQLTLDIGGAMVQANYVSGSGTNTLVFTYTILAGQADTNGISIVANSLTLNGATLKDVAGNTATSLVYAAAADNAGYMVDTSAPAAPTVALTNDSGSSATDHITNNGAWTVTDTGIGAIVEYSTDNSTWSQTVPTATTGSNTVYVRQTDTSAVVSPVTTFTFTLDTTAPDAPVASLTIDSGSNNTDKISNFGFLNLGGELGTVSEFSPDGSTGWSATLPTPVQGSNTVYVRQTDVAGNVSAVSAPFTFTYDTTAPSVTGATVFSATDSLGVAKATTLVAGDHVLATVTMSEAVTVDSLHLPSYTLELDGGQTRVATYDAALSDSTHMVFSYTVAAGDMDLTGGVTAAANALTATAGAIVDVAGNAANVSVAAVASGALVIDTTAPVAPTVTNAAVLDGQASLEVTSDIVLNMGTGVSYTQGGLIQIVNDANSGSKLGYIVTTTDQVTGLPVTPAMGETVAHSINLYLGSSTVSGGITTINAFQDAGLTTASGTVTINANGLVTVNPLYDLDLSNNYHVEIAAGTFTSIANNTLSNAAFGGVDGSGNYAMNFSTVTPGEATTAGSLAASAASTAMAANGGSMLAGHDWVSVDVAGLGSFSIFKTLNLSTKDYALTFLNASTAAGELGLSTNNVTINLSGFNANDMLYFDDQNNAGAISFEGDPILQLPANAAPFDYNGSLAYDMYGPSPDRGYVSSVAFAGVLNSGSLLDVSMHVVIA